MSYMTKQGVIEQGIKPALAPHEDDYNIEAIADDAYRFDLDEQAWVMSVSAEEFWAIVAKHDKSKG